MERLLWIGPRQGPAQLKQLLAEQGVELQAFTDADAAIAATVGQEIAVAVVTAEWADATYAIERLVQVRPDVKVLVATDAGVPRPVVLALWGGAVGVLEFKSQTRQEIVHEIQEWVSRHRLTARERELLTRLHSLNEEFLKTIVAAQKRNLELEEKLKPEVLGLTEDGPAKVLVVDDEEVVHNVLSMLLQRKGHALTAVMNGEDAVVAMRQTRFNLVITDKNLPGISGLDVLREAKNVSPDTDVIMMTGYSSMDSAIEALNLGATQYIEKPFDDVRKVSERIEGVLAAQRERVRKRRYLHMIKDRNKDFLEKYRVIRADLESWLQGRGPRS